MSGFLKCCLGVFFAWAAVSAASAPVYARDFHQCERRCQEEFGPKTLGKKLNLDVCECKDKGGKYLGRIDRLYDFDPPVYHPVEVCGLDGKTYANEDAAKAVTTVLHMGACGQCSNTRDIGVYRAMAQTLSKKTARCAAILVFFGKKAATRCFDKTRVTKGCSNCWVDSMECTAAHCLKTCLKSKMKREPTMVNGQLNDCLKCDEEKCGGMFSRCAGATRRRAGIISDIPRPDDQVWPQEDEVGDSDE